MKNNLVSIITPSYNSSRFIVECVNSVISQTFQNWEMIIVDDCSKDNSKEIILELSTKDKRIKPIFLKKNVGAAEARNTAIRQSTGKYIHHTSASFFPVRTGNELWEFDDLSRVGAFQGGEAELERPEVVPSRIARFMPILD